MQNQLIYVMLNTIAVISGILVTVLVIGNTLPSFAQNEWQVYHVNATLHEGTGFKNQEFKIPYKINNGSMGEIKSDIPSLKISIANAKNNGILVINLPTDLVEYYNKIIVGGVSILVNDKETEYPLDFHSPSCFKTISIKFDSNSKDITMHPYELTTMQLGIGKPYMSPLYISVNKNNYDPQIVTLSGCTDLKLDDKEVTLQISNLQGQTFKTISVIPDVNGTFSTLLPTEELHGNGTYIVNATYAGQSTTETFTLSMFQQTNSSALLPLKQFKSGTSAKDVKCNQDLVLVIKKSDNSPACVKPSTAQKLLDRNWSLVETWKSDNLNIGIISRNTTSVQNYPESPIINTSNQTLAHLPTIKNAMLGADIHWTYNQTINDNEARLALGVLDFHGVQTSNPVFAEYVTNIEYYGKYYWMTIDLPY
jgi:hypothetical protein